MSARAVVSIGAFMFKDDVWEVVDATLPRDATLDVSLILAFAPDELASAEH